MEPMQNPPRSLNLAGATNFRDLGGYAGLDGRTLRWRKLFRSDHLAALTSHDLVTLSGLAVTRAFDFRGAAERAAVPYDLPGVLSHSLAIEPTVLMRMKERLALGQSLTAQGTVGLMQESYRAFVHDNSPRFAELFGHLLENDAPLVFHCTAGKDRTGFAAALILLTLGVPRPVVMQDYLLTNEWFVMPLSPPGLAPKEVLDVLWGVQAGFLDAALEVVDADYGGMPMYLEKTLGLDPEQRQRLIGLYLQPL
jgi:protein-tyrosine phosphatase